MNKTIAGALLVTATALAANAVETASTNDTQKGEGKMPYITLNDGNRMPQLGFGTWTLKGDIAANSVREALRLGYRLVDTAHDYGNEADVGRGIRESGVPREEIFVTTKVGPQTLREGRTRESVEESLEKLGLDYLDLVLIHWPVHGRYVESWKALEALVREGKVKSIGLSNFNPHHVDDILDACEIRPVLDQIELHPFLTQPGVVGAIFDRGLAVEAWAPLGSGGGDLDEPALARIAGAHGRTPAQVVLRWHLQRGVVAIPRSSNPAHIAENLAVLDFELTPAEMAIVSGLDKNRRNFHKNDPESFPW